MPLLFADGYPTALNKITEQQLEKFIPFMVQCSLGYIQIHSLDEFTEPEWWPKDVEFTKPFRRPKSFTGNWLQTMREIVVVCYSFHDCIYLLRYCNDLASYQPTSLRFINNYNSTTSLYERKSNKLLVTFRNENMLYDQEQKINSRKCLLPKQSSSQYNQMAQEEMEHERVCVAEQSNQATGNSSDDDDVIFCGEVFDQQLPLESSGRARTEQQKKHFLAQNFTLACVNSSEPAVGIEPSPTKTKGNGAEQESGAAHEHPPGKHRRIARSTRYAMTLGRCPLIPLSSPLGQSLIKSTKASCSPEYATERLERMDRFCYAPTLAPGIGELLRQHRTGQDTVLSAQDRRLPKWMFIKPRSGGAPVPTSYKRPADEPLEHYHDYKFPRRQYSTKHRMENFLFYNKPLIDSCRPCAVRLKRLKPSELDLLIEWPGVERRKREAELAAEQERQRREAAAARPMIIASIDLCSSDEEEMENEENETSADTRTDASKAHEIGPETPELQEDTTDITGSMDVDLETIVLEGDDGDLVPRSGMLVDSRRQTPLNELRRSTGAPISATNPPSPFHSTLLSERALRLNQSLPTAATGTGTSLGGGGGGGGRPMYLYANCTRTSVGVGPGTPGAATIADSNRLLKENRIAGWMQNGIGHVGGDGARPTALPMMAQSHTTMLLATPNGARTLYPMAFANGSVGAVPSHVGGPSVVQTLTTTTFVNQTVHKRQVTVARTSGPTATAVNGAATAANLQ
ncbi:AGAP002153-PA-like protein [Anopheles sinensis]|uniref:AGAP002153-PA-like protein n=1 Tax=Anopheles sinensis TaxID=74873 RepID=A0A084WSA0_ANOSI|nr:AGAP002153-PA-like protein [Anopheles sinensis]